jgi:hypothetical protein
VTGNRRLCIGILVSIGVLGLISAHLMRRVGRGMAEMSDVAIKRNTPFILQIGQRALGDGIVLRLVNVELDDRCPQNSNCEVAGGVTASIELNEQRITVSTSVGRAVRADPHTLHLIDVQPPRGTGQISEKQYRLRFIFYKNLKDGFPSDFPFEKGPAIETEDFSAIDRISFFRSQKTTTGLGQLDQRIAKYLATNGWKIVESPANKAWRYYFAIKGDDYLRISVDTLDFRDSERKVSVTFSKPFSEID